MVRVWISRSAERELLHLQAAVPERFAKVFDELDGDRSPRPRLDINPLRAIKGAWRLRFGPYRGISEMGEEELRFTRFGHRKDTYRF